MKDKNIAIGIVVILGVLVGTLQILNVGLPKAENVLPLDNISEEGNRYERDDINISFYYPDNYFLQEEIINQSQRYHEVIVLTDNNFEYIENSEGPTSITINVFQNNLDNLSGRQFIEGSGFSNYKLSPTGEIEEGFLNNREAYRYFWDGLYRGESIVAATDNYIYMFSVTYLSEDDQIRRDFYEILETLDIE